MRQRIRNLGRPGLVSCAVSAVDTALWDLKARLLGLPLADVFGALRDEVSVYGSGGFTSYDDDELAAQLGGWAAAGFTLVKMKIGGSVERELARVGAARRAVGRRVQLFVDANGAYAVKAALAMAEALAPLGVVWFEEPVSSDDLTGLRLLRERAPAGMQITAGEYGYDLGYFHRMLAARAVDTLQVDASRCGGYTVFLRAAHLCEAGNRPLSAHTAPHLHAHVCLAVRDDQLRRFHVEAR